MSECDTAKASQKNSHENFGVGTNFFTVYDFLSCAKVVIKDSKGDAVISNLTVKGNIAVFSAPCLPGELKQRHLNKGSHTNSCSGLEKLFHMTPQNWDSSSRIKYRQLSIPIGPNSMGSVNQPQNKSIHKKISRNQNLNLFRRVLKLQE